MSTLNNRCLNFKACSSTRGICRLTSRACAYATSSIRCPKAEYFSGPLGWDIVPAGATKGQPVKANPHKEEQKQRALPEEHPTASTLKNHPRSDLEEEVRLKRVHDAKVKALAKVRKEFLFVYEGKPRIAAMERAIQLVEAGAPCDHEFCLTKSDPDPEMDAEGEWHTCVVCGYTFFH